jgi:hypothetical protein
MLLECRSSGFGLDAIINLEESISRCSHMVTLRIPSVQAKLMLDADITRHPSKSMGIPGKAAHSWAIMTSLLFDLLLFDDS